MLLLLFLLQDVYEFSEMDCGSVSALHDHLRKDM